MQSGLFHSPFLCFDSQAEPTVVNPVRRRSSTRISMVGITQIIFYLDSFCRLMIAMSFAFLDLSMEIEWLSNIYTISLGTYGMLI